MNPKQPSSASAVADEGDSSSHEQRDISTHHFFSPELHPQYNDPQGTVLLFAPERDQLLHRDEPATLPESVQLIAKQLTENQYECASCLEVIACQVPTWSCNCCYRVFHLNCIKVWGMQKESGPGEMFVCPHCRALHPEASEYKCFCGKVSNPRFDPHITPHSCGNMCLKRRANCKHPCTYQCHPGRCPDCTALAGPEKCPCGATTITFPCSRPELKKTCGNICGKLLNCDIHRCERLCHYDSCEACPRIRSVICECGKEMKDMPCGSSPLLCGQVCGKRLQCQIHICTLACHSGNCPPCDTDPSIIFTCPCSAKLLEGTRTKCSDPIPTCGNVCGKLLSCGKHNCAAVCHPGSCTPCEQRLLTKCRCGLVQQLVDCELSDNFRCTRMCNTQLNCGKHECHTTCCLVRKKIGDPAHECTRTCGRQLPCGHTCAERCHKGPCPSCIHVTTDPLYCRCRTEMLMPPQPCGTKPPQCTRPCYLPASCGHVLEPHACHYGDCPPCAVVAWKPCVGGHTMMCRTTCSTVDVTCWKTCEKSLPCGHKCTRSCHTGPCIGAGIKCTQLCAVIHPLCNHMCSQPCHGLRPCPKCKVMIVHKCECGRLTKSTPCSKAQAQLEKFKAAHPNEEYEMPCSDTCNFNSRLELFASRAKGKPKAERQSFYYSFFLWDRAEKDPQMVKSIEDHLERFVKGEETVMSLPPMHREKRAVVHSLSMYYHIKSHAVDTGPQRSCLLTREEKTGMPPILLSEAITMPSKCDPRAYYTSLTTPGPSCRITSRAIIIVGELVNEIMVTACLSQLIGRFIIGEAEVSDAKTRLVVLFTSNSAQTEAIFLLRRRNVTFSFWVPVE